MQTHTEDDEHTVILPRYRLMPVGRPDDGYFIHVTPEDYHIVDGECDGTCLTCGNPMESR